MSGRQKKPATEKASGQQTQVAGSSPSSDKMAFKKATVLGKEKKRRRPLSVVLACVVLAAGGIYFLTHRMSAGDKDTPVFQAQVPADTNATEFLYPLALFEDGNARHFEYKGPTGTIKYFILKSSDGAIRAAFDACDVCWRAGKGYYQLGDFMVCRNCGQKLASDKVNEVRGGCNPAPLKRIVEGNHVVIHINDILEGNQYFNFSKRI